MSTPIARAPRGPPKIAELERLSQGALQKRLASGVVCLLAAPRGKGMSQLIHVSAAGKTAWGPKGLPITKDTLFDVGGLTESLGTATIALMLAGQGRLNLSTALGRLVPEAQGGPWADTPLIALLDHTAGLPPAAEVLAEAVKMMPAPERAPVVSAGARAARITARTQVSAQGVPTGDAPLDAAQVLRIKKAICQTPRPAADRAPGSQHSALGPLLLGWAIEALTQKPLDVLLHKLVVEPLMPAGALRYVRVGPKGPLVSTPAAMTLACPYRHRTLDGEAQDRLAWLLGGVAGHSGLFATGDGAMRLLLGLQFSLQGLLRYAHAGTLQRFWTRSGSAAQGTHALGWQIPSRSNQMVPGRWSARSVGHIAAEGCAVFCDPSQGVLGVLLTNGCHPDGPPDPQAWNALRMRVFEAMASEGQHLSAPVRPQRP